MTIKRSKFNVRTDKIGKLERTADGILFDSKDECGRYLELKILERAGRIRNLEIHPNYTIIWPGTDTKICNVELDFRYEECPGVDLDYRYPFPWQKIVEDVKGFDTPLSKNKRKLVEACCGIKVKLITKTKKRAKRNGPNKTRSVSK